MVIQLTTQQQILNSIKQSDTLIIYATAAWCGPCKKFEPIFDTVSNELTDLDIMFFKIDIDTDPRVTAKFSIQGVPSLLFFRNGKEVHRSVGAISKLKLKQLIKEYLGED